MPGEAPQSQKSNGAFKTIGEAAELLGLPTHVLRFWESQFSQIKPLKRSGGRRFYRPQDIETLLAIRYFLHQEGYTIKGARKALAEGRKPMVVPHTPSKPQVSLRRQQLQKIQNELGQLRMRLAKVCNG